MTHDLIARLVFLGIGLAIGWLLGTVRRIDRHDRSQHHNDQHRNERGTTRLELTGWIVVIGLVAASVFSTSQVNDELARQQRCTETYLSGTVRALHDRTTYTGRINHADIGQNRAFARLITTVLRIPPVSETQARTITRSYSAKLDHYLALVTASEANRQRHPYPEAASYHRCLNGG